MKYLLSTTLVIVIVLGLSILGGNINAEPIINSTIKNKQVRIANRSATASRI